MARKIVFGDIHGALKALEQVVEKLKPEPSDEFVFLGDYVDGWSQSAQVIDYLMELEQSHTCIFLLGNHDAWAADWLEHGREDPAEWVRNGGAQTMASYHGYSPAQKNQHRAFFERMAYYAVDPDNRLFVHAGFSAMQGPEKEHHESSFYWDRTLWELVLAMDPVLDQEAIVYPKRLKLFREIYLGHTPTTNYGIGIPMHAHHVWNVDTGAAFRGRVTALDVDTKEFWQSDPAWSLYPQEKGRNR